MKYKVKFRYTTFLEKMVEANSPEEAVEKVNNIIDDMDDKTFSECKTDNSRYDFTEVDDEEGNIVY